MKKTLKVLFVTMALTVVGASQVFAASIGLVNLGTIIQHHKDFPKAKSTLEQLVVNYRNDFNTKYAKKPVAERRKMVEAYNAQLQRDKARLFNPINKEINIDINTVAKEKHLAGVAVAGSVIEGQTVNITNAVIAQLKK
ncbi:MAG: hypothetical protein LKJ99_06300 [Acidaminococcaceae bacterium]|nr:hypothetical protein [Acidaminococcaceae bacterium]MCI2110566.1 hypothetical protein [Acidaminococcaceae bacterium]